MSEDASNFDAVEAGPRASDPASDTRSGTAGFIAEHSSVVAMRERFGEAVLHHEVNAGDQHVVFVDPERNAEILGWLRDDPDQRYDFLADVTGVDYGGGRPVQVVYQLWSNEHKRALRVKCELSLDALSVESVTGLWNTANWLEREVFDLFGIEFRDHPDPRRILMSEDYEEGHPLRKDFPLRGRFSRAEQTRRALNPDVHHHYFEAELEMGGAPMLPEGQIEDDYEDAPAVVDDFGLEEEE